MSDGGKVVQRISVSRETTVLVQSFLSEWILRRHCGTERSDAKKASAISKERSAASEAITTGA
ncbi:hypothetical protein [Candidatus Nitrotoga sp. M5]|uniref:hypothetical protein n=1 Tax=Candidatus Nitrotoga sp. M5 TaxID=2890409 RepID=UPI001EF3C7B1|nr:hypothetical protein [Candidatus Nitrotoga sp. M5]